MALRTSAPNDQIKSSALQLLGDIRWNFGFFTKSPRRPFLAFYDCCLVYPPLSHTPYGACLSFAGCCFLRGAVSVRSEEQAYGWRLCSIVTFRVFRISTKFDVHNTNSHTIKYSPGSILFILKNYSGNTIEFRPLHASPQSRGIHLRSEIVPGLFQKNLTLLWKNPYWLNTPLAARHVPAERSSKTRRVEQAAQRAAPTTHIEIRVDRKPGYWGGVRSRVLLRLGFHSH